MLRIALGARSDRTGGRAALLRRIAVALSVSVAVTAALVPARLALLVPALIVAGGLSMGWNSLSFAAAAELGGAARSGAAIGLQQTTLAAGAVVGPPLFAVLAEHASWQIGFAAAPAFPLLGFVLLRPLSD